MSSNPFVLEEKFKVTALNPDGHKYQRVSRIKCKSLDSDTEIIVDINSDVYPVALNESLTIGIARTLSLSGEMSRTDAYDHTIYQRETVMSAYDYVMHGKVYNCNTDESFERSEIHLSFGGLLTKITGTNQYLGDLRFNTNYYLLMKKSV